MVTKPKFNLKEEFGKPCVYKLGAVLLVGGLAVSMGLSECIKGGMKVSEAGLKVGAEAYDRTERAIYNHLLRHP